MIDTDAVLRALNSRTRREILTLIWDAELPAGEIASAFDLSQPTISQHLAVLRQAGLVEMTARGTSRLYRAVPKALEGLHGALDTAHKWAAATGLPERQLAHSETKYAVVVTVEVAVDQERVFEAFVNDRLYSAWMGVPVRIDGQRFAATMEWGTEVRGRYEMVVSPQLIAMSWDFEDNNLPVPGRGLTGYLRVHPLGLRSSRVEVHQLVEDQAQADFMEAAWGLVLGRLKEGLAGALRGTSVPSRRARRGKQL